MDKRFEIMRSRFRGLTLEQLYRIRDALALDKVCYDTFNYDESTGYFCPLAIAHGFRTMPGRWTNETARNRLSYRYTPVNVLRGTPGTFYTTNRKDDLHFLVYDTIEWRRAQDEIVRLSDIVNNVRIACNP